MKNKINSCRKAFYGLQGAGFGNMPHIDSDVLTHVWNAAIRPVLTYGMNCVKLTSSSLSDMEKTQSRLLKTGFGLHKFCKSSPLLKALNVHKIESNVDISTLNLVSSVFNNQSRARSFYVYLLNVYRCGNLHCHNDLISRSIKICTKFDISLTRFIFNQSYYTTIKQDFKKRHNAPDGLSDSIRQVLLHNDPYNRHVLNLLLKSF